ncbi:hypothetical protein D9C73_019307 [Collichthys lucidus]|uniref:Uncharacterized protein n=1 Tax=Collichthys lucidus TaxID=240159 RepID=A0A4U5VGA7_COLLU|nr:hypothetical protein D9C73_019307 [Collichthys lucidus]
MTTEERGVKEPVDSQDSGVSSVSLRESQVRERARIVLEERADGPKVTGPKGITARICAKSNNAAIVSPRGTSSRQMTKNSNQPSRYKRLELL